MSNDKSLVRAILAIAVAFFSTLAFFGITLSVFWYLVPVEEVYRLISFIISAILAIGFGGYIVAWFGRRENAYLSFLFGFLFGGLSFIYILGLGFLAIALAVVSGIISGFGWALYRFVILRQTT